MYIGFNTKWASLAAAAAILCGMPAYAQSGYQPYYYVPADQGTAMPAQALAAPLPAPAPAPVPGLAPVASPSAPPSSAYPLSSGTIRNLNDEVPASMRAAPAPSMPAPVAVTAPTTVTVTSSPAPAPVPYGTTPPATTYDQLPSYQYSPYYDPTRVPVVKPVGNPPAARNWLSTASGLDIALQFSDYHYREPNANGTSVNLVGLKGGIDAQLTTHIVHSVFLTGDVRYAAGDSNYHGSDYTTDHYEGLWDVRALTGFDIIPATQDFAFAPYVGIGYRNLYSNDRGLGTQGGVTYAGYRRDNQLFYFPIGVKPRLGIDDTQRLAATIEYDQVINGFQTSYLGDVGAGDPTIHNNQDNGYGLRGDIMWETTTWGIGPFINYWNISASNPKIFVSPHASCGGTLCVGTEPGNHTLEYGVQAKYHFDVF